ncbi:MAG: AMP-binding protein [Desulfocapsa sp.]|nr:AMP-binding protein [Desulfocapsa sp.]
MEDSVLIRLLQGPKNPAQEFVAGGARFADVYVMASRFSTKFSEQENKDLPICLAAEDRAVIAAALLAALADGRILVLPHSFSARALHQMQGLTGFTAAICDVERQLSHGTQILTAESDSKPGALSLTGFSADAELLQLFTGGSTGAEKIWSKTAANIFGEALFMASRYGICEKDRIAATITPYHIYGLLFSVVIPLVASATVLAETPSFPAEITESVQRETATILASVPAHYRALQGREVGSSLRLAFSSAGMLAEEDNRSFCEANMLPIVEVYGSTETGGLATRNRLEGEEYFLPLDPIQWQVRGERLYVRSPFLSPDVTVGGDGYFLSGDKVRLQGKNAFSLHGRADAITKVGGERVDLDEVRDMLQKFQEVEECVVLPLADKTGRGNRIAALVCGECVDLEKIKHILAVSLEPAALPKIIKVVPRIPIRPNGKYDRDAIIQLLSSS